MRPTPIDIIVMIAFYCLLSINGSLVSASDNGAGKQLYGRCSDVCSLRWHNLYPAKSPYSSVTWAVTADGKCINSMADVSTAKEGSICFARWDDEAVLPDAIWNLSALGSHSLSRHLSWCSRRQTGARPLALSPVVHIFNQLGSLRRPRLSWKRETVSIRKH